MSPNKFVINNSFPWITPSVSTFFLWKVSTSLVIYFYSSVLSSRKFYMPFISYIVLVKIYTSVKKLIALFFVFFYTQFLFVIFYVWNYKSKIQLRKMNETHKDYRRTYYSKKHWSPKQKNYQAGKAKDYTPSSKGSLEKSKENKKEIVL